MKNGRRQLPRHGWVHVALLAALVSVVFANTLENELHLDSIYRVKENSEIERVRPILRHFTVLQIHCQR